MAAEDEELITFKEAARIARVSEPTVRYWVRRGRLQTRKSTQGTDKRKNSSLLVRDEFIKSLMTARIEELKKETGSNVLTIKQMCSRLGITKYSAYQMVRTLGLRKYKIYETAREFVVSERELYQAMEPHPYYGAFAIEAQHANRPRLACDCRHCYSETVTYEGIRDD